MIKRTNRINNFLKKRIISLKRDESLYRYLVLIFYGYFQLLFSK